RVSGDQDRGGHDLQDLAPIPGLRAHHVLLLARATVTGAASLSRRSGRFTREALHVVARAMIRAMRMRWPVAILLALASVAYAQSSTDSGWPAYGGDPGGARYSPLAQINRSNVTQLRVAWTYRTGALQPETPLNRKAAFEATPILLDGTLFLSTPF